MSSALEKAWYRPKSWSRILLPISWLFCRLSDSRRRRLQAGIKPSVGVPVVIVGNISVGGTGKTPLLLSIIDYFLEQGYRPGVISRGYGGKSPVYPRMVTTECKPEEVGDEPLLYSALYSGRCPVAVDPDRDRAARFLVENTDCNVIFSDDGLQHYHLHRDVEIVVVDGRRGFGNGYCLPAGPLRELPERIQEVDYVVVNGDKKAGLQIEHDQCYSMSIKPRQFRNILSESCIPADQWEGEADVHAVAGIGNPQRFTNTLQQLGLRPELHAYPDHHQYTGDEFTFDDERPVIITAKDAVKCAGLSSGNIWALDVCADVPEAFFEQLRQKIDAVQ